MHRLNSILRSRLCPLITVIVILAAGRRVTCAPKPQPAASTVLNHLNAAISWYRQLASTNEGAGKPSDTLYLENARGLARRSLQLAFQSAQSEAALLSAQSAGNAGDDGSSPQASSEEQNLTKTLAGTADRINQLQSQIGALSKQVYRAGGKRRQDLISRRDELQGELDLEKALQDAMQKISVFASNGQRGQTGLLMKISQLKQSVPGLSAAAPAQGVSAAAKQANSPSIRASGSGLIGQVSILLAQMRDMRDLDQLMDETTAVRQLATQVRAPLLNMLRTIISQGRDLASQPAASNPAQMERARQNLDSLTVHFKQLSNATLPLTQEMILLDQCHANLSQWRDSIGSEDSQILRSLLTRVFGILIGLAIIVVFSEVWRRTTVRYVREGRRRRQLLLVRRFVTGSLMVVVLALGFVTEFSSLATFAGFLTAGIAVALQTVILSIAAYFFLIGRYGVRVGDRISVSGVTGDIIDIGLVRFHMMELAGTGLDLYPTGRLVAFSNSVLFQNVPLFKQIPGAAYAWHEVAVVLPRDSNYAVAQSKLLEGVNSVYSEYRQSLERQHGSIERLTDTSVPVPTPGTQVHPVDNGFEIVVRYPVEMQKSSEIDNRVTRKLTDIINGVPELKATAGPLQIRSATKA